MTFGDLLREARIRAGFKSYTQFAKYLKDNGLPYSDEAVGHWERNHRAPQSRDVLWDVCRLLIDAGGIVTFSQIEAFLTALNWDSLSIEERLGQFAMLEDDQAIPNMPDKPPYMRLVGRTAIIQQVLSHWATTQSQPIICLSGLGGIGKTAVSYEIIRHAMLARQFDALVWESVKSEQFIGTEATPQDALSDLDSVFISYARQLNQTALLEQSPTALKKGLADLFRKGNILIILDNLETFDKVKVVAQALSDLIGAEGRSRILITSRKRLVDMPQVLDIPIAGLSYDETRQLLFDEAKTRNAPTLLQADSTLLTRAYKVTGGMPLAIKLIVTQFLLGIPLDRELERLMGVSDEHDLYRFIYFAIWRKLSTPAQKLLIGTGAIPSAMTRNMLMGVSELSPADFDTAVADLVRSSLLDIQPHPQADRQRYGIHAMTYWFVNVPLYEQWLKQQE
ncbi:MAG: NB-ARC domain-containing protein [bacterium]|nr:NB-ARC domain-containing protein [bacterium]